MLNMIQDVDFMILDWIQSHLTCGLLDRVMPAVSFLGNAGWIWITIAVLLLLWKQHRRCGMKLAVGLIICLVVCNFLLKNGVARPRPCWINQSVELLIKTPKDYSFPSGHTMTGITSAVILMCYNRRFGIPALILACLIAFSRLYLYVHFPTDILGGLLLGILAAFLTEKLASRFFPPGKSVFTHSDHAQRE